LAEEQKLVCFSFLTRSSLALNLVKQKDRLFFAFLGQMFLLKALWAEENIVLPFL
jgi:hypothetical protein